MNEIALHLNEIQRRLESQRKSLEVLADTFEQRLRYVREDIKETQNSIDEIRIIAQRLYSK